MVSCGADNKLIVWRDVTDETERKALEQSHLEAIQILEIEALTKEGRPLEALSISLRLNRPHQTRMLLKGSFEKFLFDNLDDDVKRNSSITGTVTGLVEQQQQLNSERAVVSETDLSNWVTNLKEDELKRLTEFIMHWNANGQTASLANALLSTVIKSVP